jgi:hypothetical protein
VTRKDMKNVTQCKSRIFGFGTFGAGKFGVVNLKTGNFETNTFEGLIIIIKCNKGFFIKIFIFESPRK